MLTSNHTNHQGPGGGRLGGRIFQNQGKSSLFPAQKSSRQEQMSTPHSMEERGKGEGRGRAINEKKKLISSTFQEKPAACKILHSK